VVDKSGLIRHHWSGFLIEMGCLYSFGGFPEGINDLVSCLFVTYVFARSVDCVL